MNSLAKNQSLAVSHLSSNDPILAGVIEHTALPSFKPHRDYYWALVDSIISQQLSVKSAAAIERRFRQLFKEKIPQPEHILKKSVDELKSVGLSRPKALYIRDLAEHVESGRLSFEAFDNLSNEEIIRELIDVKGIGEWTAHMFLIFCMGRLDVLAVGDYGIKTGIQKLYDLQELPSPTAIQELAQTNNWHPYESIACWYIWQSVDNKPAV